MKESNQNISLEEQELRTQLLNKLLSGLNEQQKAAVEYTSSPELVIACAGSGKTRVLTYKIAYLLLNDYLPEEIMAITFTRKAAGEIISRLNTIINPEIVKRLTMGTFHSVFARILRAEHSYVGLPSTFTIYDQADSVNTVSDVIKKLGISRTFYKAKDIQPRISWLKNNMMCSAQDYVKDLKLREQDTSRGYRHFAAIFTAYDLQLQNSGAVDFDDILLYTKRLFEEHSEVLQKYAERYRYILVDEYQDTNKVQDIIVRMLSSYHKGVCVVGDDAQSIYAFRGAIVANILNFTKTTYPDGRMFKLEENYRSTPDIIGAASSVIKNNPDQIQKEVRTSNPKAEKVHVIQTRSSFDEADFVADKIITEKEAGEHSFDDYTILYRMNSQSAQIENALNKNGIPYVVCNGIAFFQREEVKNLMAYMKLSVNPDDNESFKRIFDYPKKRIADRTLELIETCADKNSVSLFEATNPDGNYGLELTNKGFEKRVNAFREMLADFKAFSAEHNALETAMFIYERSGMKEDLILKEKKEQTEEAKDRLNNINELFNMLRSFGRPAQITDEDDDDSEYLSENDLSEIINANIPSMEEFLADVAVMASSDAIDDNTPRVKLMTMHGAKGLEFDTVFIIGCNDGTFPIVTIKNSLVDIAEERRLAYVAMTRAKKRLFMIHNAEIYLWGRKQPSSKSRFISEMDKSFYDYDDMTKSKGSGKKRNFSNFKPLTYSGILREDNDSDDDKVYNNKHRLTTVQEDIPEKYKDVKKGTVIDHNRFGIGVITKVIPPSGSNSATMIAVKFKDYPDVKKLLLRFAVFDIVQNE